MFVTHKTVTGVALVVLCAAGALGAPLGGNDLSPLSPVSSKAWAGAFPSPRDADAPLRPPQHRRHHDAALVAALAARAGAAKLSLRATAASTAAPNAAPNEAPTLAPRRLHAPTAYQRLLRTLVCQRSAHPRQCAEMLEVRIVPVTHKKTTTATQKAASNGGLQQLDAFKVKSVVESRVQGQRRNKKRKTTNHNANKHHNSERTKSTVPETNIHRENLKSLQNSKLLHQTELGSETTDKTTITPSISQLPLLRSEVTGIGNGKSSSTTELQESSNQSTKQFLRAPQLNGDAQMHIPPNKLNLENQTEIFGSGAEFSTATLTTVMEANTTTNHEPSSPPFKVTPNPSIETNPSLTQPLSPCTTQQLLPEGYQRVEGVGVYKMHEERRTWPAARAICEREGGHLVIINSQQEADALKGIMKLQSPFLKYVLVGFHDVSREGHYVTLTGETLKEAGYEKWKINEPNGFGGNEDCGSINPDAEYNDIFCDRIWPFICELETGKLQLKT